jgi:hypothetical protein
MGDENFDVWMGAYHSTQEWELFGLFMMSRRSSISDFVNGQWVPSSFFLDKKFWNIILKLDKLVGLIFAKTEFVAPFRAEVTKTRKDLTMTATDLQLLFELVL